MSGPFYCRYSQLLLELVLSSDCFWWAPPKLVEAELDQGKMVVLEPIEVPVHKFDLCILKHRHRRLSNMAILVETEASNLLQGMF